MHQAICPQLTCNPRIRLLGDRFEFISEENDLEPFICQAVLPSINVDLLTTQYVCKGDAKRIDILAINESKQLIIIEIKNSLDKHIISQLTRYYDFIKDERPFSDKVDYSLPVELWTISPDYSEFTETILKYHRLNFKILTFAIKKAETSYNFGLLDWENHQQIATISGIIAEAVDPNIEIPAPLKKLRNLIGKGNEHERKVINFVRDQIYQFSSSHSIKISEKDSGSGTRIEKTKSHPIAEFDWDNQLNRLRLYLWLPFTTVNGIFESKKLSLNRNAKRQHSMMLLWLEGENVTDIGFCKNSNKRLDVLAGRDIDQGLRELPKKLERYVGRYGNRWRPLKKAYWKGWAMPSSFYLSYIELLLGEQIEPTLDQILELALEQWRIRILK